MGSTDWSDAECMNLGLNTTEHPVVEPRTVSSCRSEEKQLACYIFVTGGFDTDVAFSECEYYNFKTDSWHQIASMKYRRYQHAVIGFEQLLYAFGGHDSQTRLSSVEYYDPLGDAWTLTTPMPHERQYHGICSFNGSIFICGGQNKNNRILSTVEEFDPTTAQYKRCPAMNTNRTEFKLAAAGGSIYAVGGYNGEWLDSVERFDPREGVWSPATSMGTKRCWHGVTVLNNSIYSTGGFGSGEKSGEWFDIRSNKWKPIPDMSIGRFGHDLVTLCGCVYAIGGPLGKKSVEKFCPVTYRWIQTAPMLMERGSNLGASVLTCQEIQLPQN